MNIIQSNNFPLNNLFDNIPIFIIDISPDPNFFNQEPLKLINKPNIKIEEICEEIKPNNFDKLIKPKNINQNSNNIFHQITKQKSNNISDQDNKPKNISSQLNQNNISDHNSRWLTKKINGVIINILTEKYLSMEISRYFYRKFNGNLNNGSISEAVSKNPPIC